MHMITDHKLDVLCLTETWLKPDNYINLNESTPPPPPKITVTNMSRIQKVKGEVFSTIYNNIFSISQRSGFKYNSFEIKVPPITLSKETNVNEKSPVMFVLASTRHHSDFIKELADFLCEWG